MEPDQLPLTPLLSTAEVARRLNVNTRTARRLMSEGHLPFVQVTGRVRRVDPADLEAFIDARSHSGSPRSEHGTTSTGWSNVA